MAMNLSFMAPDSQIIDAHFTFNDLAGLTATQSDY